MDEFTQAGLAFAMVASCLICVTFSQKIEENAQAISHRVRDDSLLQKLCDEMAHRITGEFLISILLLVLLQCSNVHMGWTLLITPMLLQNWWYFKLRKCNPYDVPDLILKSDKEKNILINNFNKIADICLIKSHSNGRFKELHQRPSPTLNIPYMGDAGHAATNRRNNIRK